MKMNSISCSRIVLLLTTVLNLALVGSLLGAVGSNHDEDAPKTMEDMSVYSFQTAYGILEHHVVTDNSTSTTITFEFSAWILFKNLVMNMN